MAAGRKTGKVIILRDVKTINTHAGHQRILLDLVKPVGVNNYAQLHEHWLQVLDVSVLNKQFYQKLFNWYLWALTKAEFPQIRPEEDKIKNDVHQSESLIRLLSRLLFCWFMKEKGLINPNLFNIDYLRKILKGFEGIRSEQTIYYKAILQNLFFATLNKPIDERKIIDKGFNKKEYGDPLVYRYEELFKDDKSVLSHFENIPFLNGGLFDCLDQKKDKDNPVEIRLDGFSTKKDKQPVMPDMFFFGEYDGIDLSEEYDDKKKSKVKVFGLLDILHQYKFTIEENTPLEEEIALDPELLGKVFENLLASYNPETKTTARKQTGSFYTPREIVNYMVDESLLCYLKNTVDDEERLRNLFSYNETINPFDKKETRALIEAINTAKILDPACGSGAFPMGMLQKLIHILHKLDPENKIWFELVIANFPSAMQNVARQRLEKENWNFVRKLGIIQECIYGVDIQPIAIQISKLRFFISLLVDQTDRPKEPNRGFEPLPNLDFKLIAANTLIAAPESDAVTTGLFAGQTDPFFQEFDLLTNEYFNVHLPKDKKDKKQEILILIDKKIAEKQKQLKRALDVKNKKQTEAGEAEIKLWTSYANLFKHEAVGFFEIKYFFPKVVEGFDVVLGNPPYVSANNMSIHDRNYFNASNQYKTLKGKWDLYVAFTEKSLVSLKANGLFTFIIPFGFLNQPFAETIREFVLKDYALLSIVDLHNNKIFESATVPSCIPLIQKKISKDHKVNILEFTDNQFLSKYQIDIQKYAEGNQHMFRTEDLTQKSDLLQKIKDNGAFLENYFYTSTGAEIHGKESRATDGTTISGKSKFDVLHSHYINGLKPYIEGSAIHKSKEGRYSYPVIDTWLDYSKPDEMRSQKFKELFDSNKIIIRGSSGLLRILAIYDESKIYTSHKCTLIIKKSDLPKNHSQYEKTAEIDLKYLLAILNSRLIDFYYESVYGGFIDVYPNNLKELPIKIADISTRNVFISIVDYLLELKRSNDYFPQVQFFDRLIDILVYELYFPNEIRQAECEVIKHLTDLPLLNDKVDNLKIIERIYKKLSSPSHPISAVMLKILNVAEVKIIEGNK